MPSSRDIHLPADSVHALRRALIRQVGAQAATRALQEAGHAVGDRLAGRLGDDQVGDTPRDAFWDRLTDLFRELDWGRVEHRAPHPGVGELRAFDWFEVEPDAQRPACPFTTGVLANVLGRAAGGEVAVLQVPCDDGSDGCVRFLFGAPHVLDRLYSGLQDGEDVEASLAALG